MSRRSGRWRLYACLSLTVALLAIGTLLVEDSVALPATTWMHMYDPGDFATTGAVITYLRELRVPIPPVISALEIATFRFTGSTDFVTRHLYRLSLVGSYVLALWFAYPSAARMLASFLSSIVFLWATTLIHPSNPQVYDLLLPLFLLSFLMLARAARALRPERAFAQIALGAGAGFCLAMAELDRPFVLLFLPFLLAGAYLLLRASPRRVLLALAIPIALLSGTWHAHLFAAHGQVLSTNYAGFNLRRAWPQAPLGPSVEETSSRPAEGERWPNLNTEEQSAASRFLERAVLEYVVANPGQALSHAAGRVLTFVRATSSTAGGSGARVLSLYALAAPVSVLFLLANLVVLAMYAMRSGRRFALLLGEPDNLLLLTAAGSLLVLSLGEANEEARLMLCILPFLAAHPLARPLGRAAGRGPTARSR